jgi:membrane protein DedA with SNARE-associated domain
MEAAIEFVKAWGYVAVFLGALVEGESIILGASALAYAGYLNIYYVGTIAFFSTTIAEQTCYFIGRHYGMNLFNRFPRLKPSAEKAFVLLKKIDVIFILTCRFIYGIRTVSPLVIGAAGISPQKFIPLNILAAAIWSVSSCWLGYELGEFILNNFDKISAFIRGIFVWLPLIVLAVIVIIYYFKRIRRIKKV